MQHLLPIHFLPGLLVLALLVPTVAAQPVTRAEADSLRRVLPMTKPGADRAGLLLQLGQYHLYKPEELPADLAAAAGYARQALDLYVREKDPAGQVESLALLSKICLEGRDFDQVLAYRQRALSALGQVKDAAQLPRLWGMAGDCYRRTPEEMPAKLEAYQRALALYRQTGNREGEAYTLKDIADMHQVQGKYAQSLAELLEVLRIQKSIGDRNLHYTHDLLGYVYTTMGCYEQALPHALDAVESARDTRDTFRLDLFYLRVATIYKDLGQHRQALGVYRRLLTKRQREGASTEYIIHGAGHISGQLLALGQPDQALAFLRQTLRRHPPRQPRDRFYAAAFLGDVYLQRKSYALAEAHLLEALRLSHAHHFANHTNETDYIVSGNLDLSQLYAERGQYLHARHCLERAFSLAGANPTLLQRRDLQLQAFKLDSLQGNLTMAIAHYQRYKILTDSMFNERKSNQLIAYQVHYNTRQQEHDLTLKEKSIALLVAQSRSQLATIGQRQTERNALIGGTALLLALLALGYNRYRLKQRSNRQLEAHQHELKAQHEELQSQQEALQAQQKEIHEKNEHLSELLAEKDCLLAQKDTLIGEKEDLLQDKDCLLSQQLFLLTGQERLLAEKERLLREIHHRVKNNLQIVMSLLNSQAESLQDKAALSAIQESQHRVQAMALIHQKLYQSEGVARIPMDSYIREVVAYLSNSYCLSEPVRFNLDVEGIDLDVTQAVPLGLIINEAITNAFKYAFPGGRAGAVGLSLRRLAGDTCQLTIADDGVGLPTGYDPARSRSLGMTLLHGFSAQLGGELTLSGPPGLTICLVFAEAQLSPVAAAGSYAS
jgi:two-component sensor histidine kinase/tetratricopeptide (TPR) repeat protein